MQLTKDDVTENDYGKISMDYSKFQQVVEFYEKYIFGDGDFEKEQPKLHKFWMKSNVNDLRTWLFNYCFKDGLK